MNYSALERLDIKFSELIGAIEEKQVDGQLSNKDHGDYELVCYCRGFIEEELKKERLTRPVPSQQTDMFAELETWIKENACIFDKKDGESYIDLDPLLEKIAALRQKQEQSP